MKKILLIALMFFVARNINAQNTAYMKTQQTDSAAIQQALEDYYFKGIYEGDLTKLNQIFHPGTQLFGDVKGLPYAKTLVQYLDGVRSRQNPKDSGKPFRSEVLNIKVINSIAIAAVRIKMYDFNYFDFLSFHKIDGKWVIVNKLMSDVAE
jgi:hypothetical protein